MQKKTTVLIFGTFNPVTKAHINMGIQAHQVYPDADVYFVPTHRRYLEVDKRYSDTDILSDKDRLLLLKAAAGEFSFKVCTLEMENKVSGKTYDTVKAMQEFGDVTVCFGSDNLEQLHEWYRAEELVKENKFLVISRGVSRVKIPESLQQYSDNFHFENGIFDDVSSTKAREALRNSDWDTLRKMVPLWVYGYLIAKKDRETRGKR